MILLCISGNIFSKQLTANQRHYLLDSLFAYKSRVVALDDTLTRRVYMKHTFKTHRRNPTLFLVPTMYSIAKGRRNYIRESYGTVQIVGSKIIDYQSAVVAGTIRKNRRTAPIIVDYATPDLYSELLFGESVLSPFFKGNEKFYNYEFSKQNNDETRISFSPKISNTQLVSGWAIVDSANGRVINCRINGHFDMIAFVLDVEMGEQDGNAGSLIPKKCTIKSLFKFVGNKIECGLNAYYYNPSMAVPDSVCSGREAMDSYRPVPLSVEDEDIYKHFNSQKTLSDTTSNSRKEKDIAEKTIDIIEDNLLSSLKANSKNASVKISPVLDPLQLSYSSRRGLSYRMKIDTRYNYSSDKYWTFKPRVGYNFKIKRFYYSAPLRLTLSKEKNNWIEMRVANGNQITNSTVLDVVKGTSIDTIDFSRLDLDYFNDQHVKLIGNMSLNDEFELTLGCTYHNREAENKRAMAALGRPTSYKSFAPLLTLSYQPNYMWPVFTANYERSIKGIIKSNIEYERWEFDASYKKELGALKKLNVRLGGGFYTNKSTDYFVDFANFHEEYLPEGWDDDWTGNFQLLNSEWYNASRYYLRLNTSYESPLMLVSRLPFIGKYIETERLYLGLLRIQHTRPYCELGYGFTNKYFSIGAFGSFLNGSFQEFGCKFTFELFRRW